MDEPRYRTETVRRIARVNRNGDRTEVGSGDVNQRVVGVWQIADDADDGYVSFWPDEARLVASAMLACADEISARMKADDSGVEVESGPVRNLTPDDHSSH